MNTKVSLSSRAISILLMLSLLLSCFPAGALTAQASSTLAGKTISVLGDSISTFAGVSNDTSANATLQGGAVYYAEGTLGITRKDTWWQQTVDALDLELLVNNSWSGSCILHTRAGTVGAYADRCVQLHNDKTGEEPDIIAVFLGTNDFSYYQSALGTADIDYDSLITANPDGTFTYADPSTSCEAYAIMLHKMTLRYPNAEVYCMNLLPRRNPVNSGADVGQPTAFNAELAKIISRFGCTLVDLENCGITSDPANFDGYITDKRVHPGPKGMDLMTQALVRALYDENSNICDISFILKNVTAATEKCVTLSGSSYSNTLTAADGFDHLTVSVTMGGEDVTASCVSGGKIDVESVTGDIVISAAAIIDKEPETYRWVFDGADLDAVTGGGSVQNALTKIAGSCTDGVLSNTRYQLANSVVLCHDREWAIEWKCSGDWSGMLLSSTGTSGTKGMNYLFRTYNSTKLLAFGEYTGSRYENYGIALAESGIDPAAQHVYRVENRVTADGSNMAYLTVDGVELGAMNNFYIAGTSNQNNTVNWISGRDFVFDCLGSTSHPLNNMSIEYLQVWEDREAIADKTISILGASISTYQGTSNGAAADTANSTIRNNVKYYPNTTIPEVTLNDTWWMQVADDLDLRLLVNNAWSGSAILLERAGTKGAYVDRCVQLHDDTGTNAGEEPDIICIQMGFNDFSYGKATLGTADIDYETLITEDGYGTPATTMEATAIMLDKMTKRYPNAEIYMFNHFKRVGQSDSDTELMENLNAAIDIVCTRFDVTVVDLYSVLNSPDYVGDGRLHPNCLGMDVISEAVKRAITANTVPVVLSLRYDDRYDVTDKTVEIIDAGTPTSYQVGYGVEENTVLDTAVVTLEGEKLIATGIGTAIVKIDGVTYEITVETAPISLLLLAGQSNMQGSEGNANQSIICPDGMVYSTYGDRYTMTIDNATNFAPSALTGTYSELNVNGTTANLSDWPVYLLNEKGAGKAGPDSGFAYEWVKSTGEKVWIVNAAHGGTSINVWQPGTTQYEECQALFTACTETLRKEIAAGHFTLNHMAYFWCQGCTDRSQSAKWYGDRYLAMHEAFKTELAFDHDSDSATADKTFEFGGIIPVRVGSTITCYRDGVNTDSNPYAYHESFVDLRMSGPRVAQYLMGCDPTLPDIWTVCTVGEDWVWMPDGTNGVSDYFNKHYANGTVDYEPQVAQSASWYTPTTPKAVHDSIHYNQIGYNEVGRESVRNALIMLGEKEDYAEETSVKFVDWTGYKEVSEITASTTAGSGTLVVPMISPITRAKTVTFTHSEGLKWQYGDLTADTTGRTGTLSAVGAEGGVSVVKAQPGQLYTDHLAVMPEAYCGGTDLWKVLEHDEQYFASGTHWAVYSSGREVPSVTISVEPGNRIFATSFGKSGENGHESSSGIRITFFGDYGVVKTMSPAEVYAEFTANGGYLIAPEGTTAVNVPMWNNADSNELYVLSAEHTYTGTRCSVCGAAHPNAANYKDKVVSILSASTSTFAGYIPVADGFNLTHRTRYPDTSRVPDVTGVDQTWWMQLITQLDAKLGINDSWAGSQVLNTLDANSGDLGPDAAMASMTRIQNLGANGDPDLILFFGAGNDMGRGVPLGSFDPAAAPTAVDLTATKWETLADAYVAAIMRLQHTYPDARIVAVTTYAMPSYATAAKLNKYIPVLKAICDHYGVPTVDLRDSGVTFDMLPDNIHPNAEGMDYITEAVLNKLLSDIPVESGENTVYSVSHELSNAIASLGYYKGVSAGAAFAETLTGDDLTVTVTMGGVDITADVYEDGKIAIPEVTGDIVITARAAFNADGHLQQLPEDICAGTNLWTALEPEKIYYTATGWGNTAAGTTWSVTFPVQAGDRIWATSLGAYPGNGSSANGVRVTWFDENGVLKTVSRDVVYSEFAANGYLTAPEGAVALNLPMTGNEPNYAIYLLDRTHNYESSVTAPTCTKQGYTTYTCTLCGDSHVADFVDATGHSYEAAVAYPAGLTKGYTDYACTSCADAYRTDWLDAKAYAGKTIACIGDSITAAYGVTKDETDYVYLLAEQLGMDYIRLGDSGTTLCTDGSRTCNIRRLTENDLQSADIVTIAMGINDFCNAAEGCYELGALNSTDSSTIYGAVRMWCERIEELRKTDSLSHTQFCFVTPVITSWNNSVTSARNWDQSKENIHGYTLRDLCNAIIEVAALYDVTVIDLNLISGMYYNNADDNNVAAFGGDGVHPGPNGHAMMAGALANALLQNDLRDDHTHTYGSWVATKYPGCESIEEKRVCSVCTATESRVLNGTGHSYHSVITAPTCTGQGYTTHTCTLCGCSYTADQVTPLGHTEAIDKAVDPTCTEAGLTEGKHCSICGTTLVKQNTVPAKGHTPGSPVEENHAPDGSCDLVTYCAECTAELHREHIRGVLPGDVTGDGKVNNRDVTRLLQYLAGWAVSIDKEAADVTGDGKLNNRDVTRLLQYLAGWSVTLH